MLPVKADLAICSPVIGVSGVLVWLSCLDFSSCVIMSGFGKSGHKYWEPLANLTDQAHIVNHNTSTALSTSILYFNLLYKLFV